MRTSRRILYVGLIQLALFGLHYIVYGIWIKIPNNMTMDANTVSNIVIILTTVVASWLGMIYISKRFRVWMGGWLLYVIALIILENCMTYYGGSSLTIQASDKYTHRGGGSVPAVGELELFAWPIYVLLIEIIIWAVLRKARCRSETS